MYMVFSDLDSADEINNELIEFRESLTNNSSYNFPIIKGGRIIQHLVEYVYRSKVSFKNDIYKNSFEDFLSKCDFIPNDMMEFILVINKYRIDANLIEADKLVELDEIWFPFLESLKNILEWFYEYFKENKLTKLQNQLKITIDFLKREENCESYGSYQYYHMVIEKLNYLINSIDIVKKKLDQISNSLHEFNGEHKKNQEMVLEKLNNAFNNEEMEKIMDAFTKKTVKNIMSEVNRIFNDYKFEKEKKEFINFLGKENWNKLSKQSKTYLITSKIIFESLNEFDDLYDYSAVCILISKALEVELNKRFYKEFITYLKNKYGNDYSRYPPALVNNYHGKHYPKDFCTLGLITEILGGFNRNDSNEIKNLSAVTEYSKDELFKNFSNDDDEIRDTIKKYGKYVNHIRKKYRNPSAHKDSLDITTAEDCFNYVIKVRRVLKIMLDSFDR